LKLHDILFLCRKVRLLVLAFIHALIRGDLEVVGREHSSLLITDELILQPRIILSGERDGQEQYLIKGSQQTLN
jgi:hypothetical protein